MKLLSLRKILGQAKQELVEVADYFNNSNRALIDFLLCHQNMLD